MHLLDGFVGDLIAARQVQGVHRPMVTPELNNRAVSEPTNDRKHH